MKESENFIFKRNIMKKKNLEFRYGYSFDKIEELVEINRISWSIMFDKLCNFNLSNNEYYDEYYDKDYEIYLKKFMKLNELKMVDYDDIKYDLIGQFGSKNISQCCVYDENDCLIMYKEYYDDVHFIVISREKSLREKNLIKIKEI